MELQIDKKEVYRYLGYGHNVADERVQEKVNWSIQEILEKSTMKSIYRVFDVTVEDAYITIGPMKIQSRNLSRNLTGCVKAILFAATLGVPVDFLLERSKRLDMSGAVILQATAAAAIEEYCDRCQEKIEDEMERENLYLRPRFSPGYGDFSISHQKQFIELLETPRKIGLTLTDSLMMLPSKSVTAVIGLSPIRQHCHKKGCEECGKTDCLYRRS